MSKLNVEDRTHSPSSNLNYAKWLQGIDDNFEKPFLFIGMLSIILIISFQTFYRYIVTHFWQATGGAYWTEEAARYIFVWISYLAVPLAIKKRNNIRVDIVYDKLPERLQKISWILVDLCFLALAGVVFVMGLDHLKMMRTFPQTTPAMQIPYYIPYLILPVGFGLMIFRLLQDIVQQARATGLKDSFYGVLAFSAICLPLFLNFELDALVWLFGYFILFLIIGVPIAIALGLSALATIIGSGTLPIEYVAQISFTSIDSFPIMAIPFFNCCRSLYGSRGTVQAALDFG